MLGASLRFLEFGLYENKKGVTFVTPFSSGYQDSNLGPPAPKAGALTGLRYIPNCFFNLS